MNHFYIAVIVSESSSTAKDYVPLYEESFTLLKAASGEEAVERAKGMAREADDQYENVYDDTVKWTATLVEVGATLCDTLEDGAEFYARFFRNMSAYENLGRETFEKSPKSEG